MNISWVLSDFVAADPTLDVADLKRLGSFWGSWRTWRAFQTDNVICHDQAKAAELIKREFQTKCNFYIPNLIYTNLNRPTGVNVYEGEFVHDVDHQEEIDQEIKQEWQQVQEKMNQAAKSPFYIRMKAKGLV